MAVHLRRIAAIAIVLIPIGFLIVPGGRLRTMDGATAAVAAVQPSRAGEQTPRFTGHGRSDRSQPEALPSPDALIGRTFDALRYRADAGDAPAACRLAVDLLTCRNLPLMQGLAGIPGPGGQDNETAFARQGDLATANFFAEAKLSAIAARRRCAGITPPQMALGPAYLRKAALAGVGDALVRYADGQAFDPARMFAMLRDPLFDAWRKEAPGLARQALRQGNPAAVYLLYGAYSGDGSLFAGLIDNDPLQAAVFRSLIERLHGRVPQGNMTLTVAQQAQASAIAASMHRQYFGNRVFSVDELASVATALRPLTQDAPLPRCE